MTTLLIVLIVLATLVFLGNVWLMTKQLRRKRANWQSIEARWEACTNELVLTPERVTALLDLYYRNPRQPLPDMYLIEHGLISEDGLNLTAAGRGLVAGMEDWNQQNKRMRED